MAPATDSFLNITPNLETQALLDMNEIDQRIVELAALIDAVPTKFRQEIIVAALQRPEQHRLGGSWLVESLRAQLISCVSGLGDSGSVVHWPVYCASIEVREIASMISISPVLATTESLTRQLIARIADAVTDAQKAESR